MSEESKRDRSPNYPKITLEAAITLTSKLYKELGKTKVKREVAMGALGYSGVSGASLTTLGAINAYGLIEQDRGSGISISPLAISILHPTNESQSRMSKISAALAPKVFNVLYTDGFHRASEQILANHLIQNGFTPDGARKAASVFLANISFANLDSESNVGPSDAKKEQIKSALDAGSFQMHPVSREIIAAEIPPEAAEINNRPVLATYSVPIGSNEVKIVFTGDILRPEDFDALADYVALFKKQYQRKIESEASRGATSMKDVAINLANSGQ